MFRKSIILIIALLAVGLPAVQAQGGGRSTDPALNGTWVIEEGGEKIGEWTFTNGKFVIRDEDDEDVFRGTYTTNGRNLTMVFAWQRVFFGKEETLQPQQCPYYTNGYILTITFGEETFTLTRKR